MSTNGDAAEKTSRSAPVRTPEQVLPVDDGLDVVGELLLHERQPQPGSPSSQGGPASEGSLGDVASCHLSSIMGWISKGLLESRQVFHAGRDLSCLGRQLLHQLQGPPERLVLAQEGLLGWR